MRHSPTREFPSRSTRTARGFRLGRFLWSGRAGEGAFANVSVACAAEAGCVEGVNREIPHESEPGKAEFSLQEKGAFFGAPLERRKDYAQESRCYVPSCQEAR